MPATTHPRRPHITAPRRAATEPPRRPRPTPLLLVLLVAAVSAGVLATVPSSLHAGIALAFGCAIATQLSALLKHKGANDAPAVDVRHPFRTAWQLYSRKWFAIGMVTAVGAWLLHVAAFAVAPLSVVQAVLSTGVVILAVMASRLFGAEVGLRQYVGVGLAALGLVLLGVTLPVVDDAHSAFSMPGLLVFEGCLLALGAVLVVAHRIGVPARYRGVALGVAAGVLYAVSNVALKGLTGLGGVGAVLGSPLLPIAILASVVAFYAGARGMQQGAAVPVLAATSNAANVLNIVGGILVFGDPMPADPLSIGIQVLAFALVVVAAFLTPPSVRETADEPAA